MSTPPIHVVLLTSEHGESDYAGVIRSLNKETVTRSLFSLTPPGGQLVIHMTARAAAEVMRAVDAPFQRCCSLGIVPGRVLALNPSLLRNRYCDLTASGFKAHVITPVVMGA